MLVSDKADVRIERDGPLGILQFSNEPANLMTFELLEAFGDAVSELAKSDARALLIESPGPHFCGGVNVGIFRDLSRREARSRFSRGLPLVIHGLENLPFPVVVAVQGLCSAAGLELALAADIVFAGRSARFSQVEARIGTSTLLGGVQRLAERCGSVRAKEICFTSKHYDAETFERWNIINYVTEDDALKDEARAFAKDIANGPTQAHFVTKRLVRAHLDAGIRTADELILDIAPPLFDGHDMQHGVRTLQEFGARNVVEHTRFKGC